MIVLTTERCEGACVIRLDGTFDPSDKTSELVDRLVDAAGADPLLVDLSGVASATGPEVTALLRTLAKAPTRHATVLIHPDMKTRRALRARAHGLPVVPSNDLVLRGRFASALIAHEQPEKGW